MYVRRKKNGQQLHKRKEQRKNIAQNNKIK